MSAEAQWRVAYDAKVADLARETSRLSLLIQAVEADGHRSDGLTRHNRSCVVCVALREVTGAAGVPVPASFGEPFGEDDSGQSEPPTATCAHCGGPQRGSAAVGDNPLCHPNEGLDCYREVTVYGHPMPCATCVPCAQAVRQAAAAGGIAALADHPHADPDDGRTECSTCGKWVFQITHSCKGVPVTVAAWKRLEERQQDGADVTRPALVCGCGIAPEGAPGAVGCSPSCMTPEPDVTVASRANAWAPSENCYCGGPEEIYAHRMGTGYYCRRALAEHREEQP